ncbi:hypothetical protein BURPS668_3886 [Burkholderia pseudomallei 668]|nr:hypothetical protein BURPS668_3886 [Burkholderia pseudomallei 668]
MRRACCRSRIGDARARARGGVNRGFGTRRARDADEMPFPRAISRVNVSVFFRSCTD